MSELSADTARIVLEARGPSDQVAACCRGIDGVLGVEVKKLGDDLARYDIQVRKDMDLTEEVSQRLAKNGWPIRRLEQRARRLEDLFIEVVLREPQETNGETAPPGDAAAPNGV
jgi:hypothetical protein